MARKRVPKDIEHLRECGYYGVLEEEEKDAKGDFVRPAVYTTSTFRLVFEEQYPFKPPKMLVWARNERVGPPLGPEVFVDYREAFATIERKQGASMTSEQFSMKSALDELCTKEWGPAIRPTAYTWMLNALSAMLCRRTVICATPASDPHFVASSDETGTTEEVVSAGTEPGEGRDVEMTGTGTESESGDEGSGLFDDWGEVEDPQP